MAASPADPWTYSYLLGVYLGDGRVQDIGCGAQLRVRLDAAYPAIVEECWVAVQLNAPMSRATIRQRRGRKAKSLDSASKRWVDLLPPPGHGQGQGRATVLAPWQQDIVDRHPERFLRGLIHSDGCRTINRFTTRLPSGRVREYAYPRYFFSNESPDIRAVFCRTCDLLGVHWTQSNRRSISVSQRPSVARLDEFIGPKS